MLNHISHIRPHSLDDCSAAYQCSRVSIVCNALHRFQDERSVNDILTRVATGKFERESITVDGVGVVVRGVGIDRHEWSKLWNSFTPLSKAAFARQFDSSIISCRPSEIVMAGNVKRWWRSLFGLPSGVVLPEEEKKYFDDFTEFPKVRFYNYGCMCLSCIGG